MVIAIDGPAGSGKSSVAKMLARRHGLTVLNTGSFYRAAALIILRTLGGGEDGAGAEPVDIDAGDFLVGVVNAMGIEYRNEEIFVDDDNLTPYIRSDAVEKIVAPISSIPAIRRIMNVHIRSAAENRDIVCEGRDITTVVFPDTHAKFYLDASVEARALRRFTQGTSKLSLEEITSRIRARDYSDTHKAVGSLKISKDAVYFDTTGLTILQVCERIEHILHTKGLFMEKMEVEKDVVENSGENIQTQLQEEYMNFEPLEEGAIKEGTVVAVDGDDVIVDVGGKFDGRISVTEFGAEPPHEGDVVNVLIERTEAGSGRFSVSKIKADRKVLRDTLYSAQKNHTLVEGTIAKQIKGGFEVSLGADMTAFLPISQADSQKVENPESLLGMKSQFYIERFGHDRRGGRDSRDNRENIVVNRRKYLEEYTEQQRNDFFENTQIGDSVTGVVKSFTSFGAFVDLGGFDGLLHINDMSWGHVTRPKDFVKKGQEIEFKVIRLDPQERRINLSLKHFTPDPWLNFEDKFQINDIVTGHVTKITEFGAFIELAEGIEGLAHISEFSWVKKINKPEDMVKQGDEVECMILGYDIQAGRVSLGLKQVTDNPWDTIDERYPVGTRLTRKVVKITTAGAFVQLEEGIDGFLHVDDISWTKRVRNPASELEVGKEIEVIVINCDVETHRLKLGIKQLEDNPWETFAKTYKPGSSIEGEVTSVTDFGLFLKVPGGIEGLIHKQNLTESRDENPDEVLKKYAVGDMVKAVVVDVNIRDKKLAFSVRDYKKKLQKEDLSHYMSGENQDDNGGITLGDLINAKPAE